MSRVRVPEGVPGYAFGWTKGSPGRVQEDTEPAPQAPNSRQSPAEAGLARRGGAAKRESFRPWAEARDAELATTTARWSSGQDGGLSRRKREFDSPTGHHPQKSGAFLGPPRDLNSCGGGKATARAAGLPARRNKTRCAGLLFRIRAPKRFKLLRRRQSHRSRRRTSGEKMRLHRRHEHH